MEESDMDTGLQTVLFVFLAALLIVIIIRDLAWTRDLPPGPWGLPLFGHLPFLGKNPHITFTRMYKKYGPVFRIRMGSYRTVVISEYDAMKEALIDKAPDFDGRPDFNSFQYVAKRTTFTWQSYSPRWRLHRRTAATGLRMFSTTRKPPIDEVITEEAQHLAQFLLKECARDHIIDPFIAIRNTVASIIFSICFGDRSEFKDDPQFHAYVQMVSELITFLSAGGNAGDLIPWLRPFTQQKLNKFITMNERLRAFVDPHIKMHLETFQEGELRDALDAFIQATRDIPQSSKDDVGLSDEAIIYTIISLIVPGISTVTSTLHWCILYLVAFPEAQKRIQKEIDDIIGTKGIISHSDRARMSYTEAFIAEVFRYSSIGPLSLPHFTICDTQLQGYKIPKNTLVFFNVYAINEDESLWKSPELFVPERFLMANGKVNRELAEVASPFGHGKRRCLGEHLGRLQVFLVITNLLRCCHFEKSPDHPVTLKPKEFGLSLDAQPYKVCIKHRDIVSS